MDANVLVRLYLEHDAEGDPRELLTSREARRAWPFPLTTLLRLEFANALQRMVYAGRKAGQWRVTPESAAVASADFAEQLETGTFVHPVPLTLDDLEPQFESLVGRHTAKHGFRTYDILHVVSALHLGCDTFWSFDAKALQLARLEGLKTNR
ncbi:MAG: PIN domain-containing protein [Verrucomicrobiota bacterium]|nr:PIN domain-containing protein [Verrucomicrobiota bacterium]